MTSNGLLSITYRQPQGALSTCHLYIQLDPFALKLAIYRHNRGFMFYPTSYLYLSVWYLPRTFVQTADEAYHRLITWRSIDQTTPPMTILST